MRALPLSALVAAVATTLLTAALPAEAQNRARSEALDMEDKDRALVSKESVKAQREKRENQRKNGSGKNSSSGSDSDCGSVDIGNDDQKKASSRISERQKTIIVTGNIINNANCR